MSGATGPSEERLALARAFLQEAVYRSRGDQAGAALFAADPGGCGLGSKASVVLDLTPRAEGLFRELGSPEAADLAEVRDHMRSWVERQDALDRKRNHFLKAFRAEHGADRRAYPATTLGAFEAGLERINSQVEREREEAAMALLGLL